MKILLTLSLSLFASISMACTNFSGSYKDEVSQDFFVSQKGCSTVTVTNQEGTETIIADGKYRVTEENEEVKITAAAKFVEANLTVDGKIEYKEPFPAEFPVDMIPIRSVSIYTLDSLGNLIINISVYNSDNQVLGEATQVHQKM